jgi:hypothetical protein
MSTTATSTGSWLATTPQAAQIRRSRALAVGAATLAAVAVWAIAVPGLGVHLVTRFGHAAPSTVHVYVVLAAALVASLLGWALLDQLERRTTRAHAIWGATAAVVLLASLGLPLSAATTTSAKLALVAMHLTVAGVLVPLLLRRSPRG